MAAFGKDRAHRSRRSEKTEHTDRGAIQGLLKAFAEHAEGQPKVQHEPKRIAGKGAPDFKITRAGLIVGYVETKALGETLRQNIVLTDYCAGDRSRRNLGSNLDACRAACRLSSVPA